MIETNIIPREGGESSGPGKVWKHKNKYGKGVITMKQKKIFWSTIVCCIMLLAICSPVFATDVSLETDIPMLTDEEMHVLHEHEHSIVPHFEWYDCPNCPAGQMLAMVCVRPMTPSHTTKHTVSGGTCSILWFTGTYRHECLRCGYIEPGSTISGHTCELNHSKCPDESWCQAEAVVY